MSNVVQKLNYLWRLLFTGVAFWGLFLGGGLIAITILPLILLFPNKNRLNVQHIIHKMFLFYIDMLQFLKLITLNITFVERLKYCSGKIVIANHPTLLDVVVLMALIPKAQCIVKHELWNHPLLGGVVRQAGYIRNDLEPELLIEMCKKSLDDGFCLIIFPEGTRTKPGNFPHFQRGFAHLATMIETTIVPVFIDCDPPTLIKGESWWKIPISKPIFHFEIAEDIDKTSYFHYVHRSLNARKLVKILEFYYKQKIEYAQSRRRVKKFNN